MFSSFLEWLPLWGQLVVLAVGFVFVLAFMMMPFAVFGVKGRITELSIQIEELQEMVRVCVIRMQNQERIRHQQNEQPEEIIAQEIPSKRDMSKRITVEEIQTVKQPYVSPYLNSRTRDDQNKIQTAYPKAGEPNSSIKREGSCTLGLDEKGQELPPILPEIRVPRVSDAYEARQVEVSSSLKSPIKENKDISCYRLPWHDDLPQNKEIKSQMTQETEEETFSRQNPPDVNLPPYKPDFSSDYHANPPSRSRTGVKCYPADRQDLNLGRTEPVLNWPRRS